MKKIDLHLHTISTPSDSHFEFSLEKLKQYAQDAELDAIAITNHNVFDLTQFSEISSSLDIAVFPGIEVDLEKGHVLVIGHPDALESFSEKANEISKLIPDSSTSINLEQFKSIFDNLEDYLLIPHYVKSPAIPNEIIEALGDHVYAGEVDSLKKFIRVHKDSSQLVPVLFSDARMSEDLDNLPLRHTYIDCGDISFSSLKNSLKDRSKVSLSESDGNKLFTVFENGQMLSTGLNILLGDRSSGKTVTLNKLNDSQRAKYIRQFSLVQQDEEAYKKEFEKSISSKRNHFTDEFLLGFKRVTEEISKVSLRANLESVDEYLSSLKRSAEHVDKNDSFSKTSLFNEVLFETSSSKTLEDLLNSTLQLIENIEYRETISKHVDLNSLKALFCELVEELWENQKVAKSKRFVNNLIKEVKQGLQIRTSAIQVADANLYEIALDQKKVDRFKEIAKALSEVEVLRTENVQGFTIDVSKRAYQGAQEIKNASKTNLAFSEAFSQYNDPYEYLHALLSIEGLDQSIIYKLFAKIDYRIKNKDGADVSGGERSEFRLLQEIKDAQNYDMLLIDEPESSFDNIFLKSSVNQIIKEISETMPVVVVTHNNTVGASIQPDYILYACKDRENDKPNYRVYSGYPSDAKLFAPDGRSINHKEKILSSLEAGADEYIRRKNIYENIENTEQ